MDEALREKRRRIDIREQIFRSEKSHRSNGENEVYNRQGIGVNSDKEEK